MNGVENGPIRILTIETIKQPFKYTEEAEELCNVLTVMLCEVHNGNVTTTLKIV